MYIGIQRAFCENGGKFVKSRKSYFSKSGNNYVNGSIVNLPVGNTEIIAKKIQEMSGGDRTIIPIFGQSMEALSGIILQE